MLLLLLLVLLLEVRIASAVRGVLQEQQQQLVLET
jgi:hypothetical protein